MNLTTVSGAVLILVAALLAVLTPAPQTTAREPRFIRVSSTAPETNAQLSALITDVRNGADAFVFLSGGASKMREDHQRQLLAMFDALSLPRKPATASLLETAAPKRASWRRPDSHPRPAALRFR